MKTTLSLFFAILSLLPCVAQNAVFGFAACTSMTDATPYQMNGGDGGSRIVLQSTGSDMREIIIRALTEYDEVVLDGSRGDFVVSSTMRLEGLRNKTLRGENGARVCTQFVVTPEIHHLMDSLKVKERSTKSDGTIYNLSNGSRVKEECEAAVRQALIDYLHDDKETFRHCGLFNIVKAENLIIRDLQLVGPGAIDISGDDLLNLQDHCRHVWIDHCDFLDGVDGNFDINTYSDLITVSWCHFHYSDRTYIHANTNLVGSSDNAERNGVDALNVTFAYCHWGRGCKQRMPMARFGTIHLLNNYYDCVGNTGAMNPRRGSEFLIEGNYFDRGVRKIFAASDDALAFTFRANHFEEHFTPQDRGAVTVPYTYTMLPVEDVPTVVGSVTDR